MPDKNNLNPLIYVMMGVSASGKSTVGSKLAAQLGCDFIEGDDYHPQANIDKMKAGEALSDEDRLPWLQALAAAVADHVHRKQLAVVACSALKCSYRKILSGDAAAHSHDRQPTIAYVLLDPSREELIRRLTLRQGHFMPLQLLESQIAALQKNEDFYLHILETEVRSAYFEAHELAALAKLAGGKEIGHAVAGAGFPDAETIVKLLDLMRPDRGLLL